MKKFHRTLYFEQFQHWEKVTCHPYTIIFDAIICHKNWHLYWGDFLTHAVCVLDVKVDQKWKKSAELYNNETWLV